MLCIGMGEFVSQIVCVCVDHIKAGVDINYTFLRFCSPWLLFFSYILLFHWCVFVCFVEPTVVMAFIFLSGSVFQNRGILYSIVFISLKNLSDLLHYFSHPFFLLCLWLRRKIQTVPVHTEMRQFLFFRFGFVFFFKYLFHRCTRTHCAEHRMNHFSMHDVMLLNQKQKTTQKRDERTQKNVNLSPALPVNNYSFNPASCVIRLKCDCFEERQKSKSNCDIQNGINDRQD